MGRMMFTKYIVVADDDVDVRNNQSSVCRPWTASNATLVENTPQPPTIGAGTVVFNFTDLPGRIYQVQRAPSPTGPWEIVGPMTIRPDGSGDFVDPSPLPSNGFYRTWFLPSP